MTPRLRLRGQAAALSLVLIGSLAAAQSPRDRIEALIPAPDPYAELNAADRALIARESVQIFGAEPAGVAFFTGPDCPHCARAAREIDALARRFGTTVKVHDTRDSTAAALHDRLRLPDLPAYVIGDKLISGWLPDFILVRYLAP